MYVLLKKRQNCRIHSGEQRIFIQRRPELVILMRKACTLPSLSYPTRITETLHAPEASEFTLVSQLNWYNMLQYGRSTKQRQAWRSHLFLLTDRPTPVLNSDDEAFDRTLSARLPDDSCKTQIQLQQKRFLPIPRYQTPAKTFPSSPRYSRRINGRYTNKAQTTVTMGVSGSYKRKGHLVSINDAVAPAPRS